MATQVRAQIDPQVRDDVVPAVLQVAIQLEVTENGVATREYLPIGSATVVSPEGLVLTNFHVVDMSSHQEQLDAWEAQAASEGEALTLSLDTDSLLLLGTRGVSPPEPMYQATIVGVDETLDLAVLNITSDAYGAPVAAENQPFRFVPIGDSSTVQQGDPVDLFGYPMISGGTLTYTAGVVSGFNFESGIDGPAWIITDATMSGGSSGGTALDRTGRLIGIPTQGTALDCRPGDINHDGRVDSSDVGCIPTGGSIGEIRPINLAEKLLATSGFSKSTRPEPSPIPAAERGPDPTPEPELSVDLTTTGDPSRQMPALMLDAPPDEAYCSTSPIYPVGERVVTVGNTSRPDDALMLADGWWDDGRVHGRFDLPLGSVLEITGPLVETGSCDWWPVIVKSVSELAPVAPPEPTGEAAPVGMTGFVYEARIRSESDLCSHSPEFRVGSRAVVEPYMLRLDDYAPLFVGPTLAETGIVAPLRKGTVVEILAPPFPKFYSDTLRCSYSWNVRVVEKPVEEVDSTIGLEGWMTEDEVVPR